MDTSPEWLRYMQSKVGDNYIINQTNVGGVLQKDEAFYRANKQMSKEISKLPICKVKYVTLEALYITLYIYNINNIYFYIHVNIYVYICKVFGSIVLCIRDVWARKKWRNSKQSGA